MKLPFGAKSLCLTTGRASAFSVSVPGGTRQCQTKRNMQQTIEFRAEAQERKQLDVRATIQRKIQSINLWLDTKSEFYSRICEFNVTRRLVLRINIVTLCLCITAACVEQQPVASLVSALCAAYVVYRVNKTDKKGGEK